jgi:hypothetical protein
MSDRATRIVAIVGLIVLALPTGLCSLAFSPMAISGLFFSHDALEQSIGTLAAIMSGVGFVIAGLTIYFAAKVLRRPGSGASTGARDA